VVALLGPNGAGKTTALSVLLGLRRPDRGEATLFGAPPGSRRSRARIGVAPQEVDFPQTLRVGEIVELVRAHYAAPRPSEAVLAAFGLAPLAGRQAGGLSGGERRRLAVALAFVGSPELVFLDEPSSGMDVEARRGLWEGVRSYAAAGGTVLLTSHNLEEVEALASRVVVARAGRVVALGSVAELRGRIGLRRVRLGVPPPPDLAGVIATEQGPDGWTLLAEDVDALVRALVRAGVSLDRLEVLPASLEDALLEITGEGGA